MWEEQTDYALPTHIDRISEFKDIVINKRFSSKNFYHRLQMINMYRFTIKAAGKMI